MYKMHLHRQGVASGADRLAIFAATAAQAQLNQQGGGRPQGVTRGGGGAGGGRGVGASGGGAVSRQYYPPGTVGEAIVTSDPETPRLIVITDEETKPLRFASRHQPGSPQAASPHQSGLPGGDLSKRLGFRSGFWRTASGGEKGTGRAPACSATRVWGSAATGFSRIRSASRCKASLRFLPGAGVYQIIGQDFQATLRAIAAAGKRRCCRAPPFSRATISRL
jgi:hypothetical protein